MSHPLFVISEEILYVVSSVIVSDHVELVV